MVQTEAQYQFIYMAISQYIDTFKTRMLAGAKSLRDYTNIRYAAQEPSPAFLINSIAASSAAAAAASSTPVPANAQFGAANVAATVTSAASGPTPPPIPPSRESSALGGKNNIPMDIDNGFSCSTQSATYQNL